VSALSEKIAFLEGKISDKEYEEKIGRLEGDLEFIKSINAAGFLPDEKLEKVRELATESCLNGKGETAPLLTPEEIVSLSVRKGTLTDEERSIMESHVVMTAKILSQVTFPKEFSAVPAWASAHHELLNGKGYPNHITAEDIPPEVRLLTILDIFDALTARDRPYKPGMPAEKAFGILHNMQEEGNIDGDILALFEESKAWEEES
jgi:hypothetical protein